MLVAACSSICTVKSASGKRLLGERALAIAIPAACPPLRFLRLGCTTTRMLPGRFCQVLDLPYNMYDILCLVMRYIW
jgi:hypothetical protein